MQIENLLSEKNSPNKEILYFHDPRFYLIIVLFSN